MYNQSHLEQIGLDTALLGMQGRELLSVPRIACGLLGKTHETESLTCKQKRCQTTQGSEQM